jgi:hypothetical protein
VCAHLDVRVHAVNGDVDEWSSLSVQSNLSDTLLAIVIPGAAHCDDMTHYDTNDTTGHAATANAQQVRARSRCMHALCDRL